MIISQRFAQLKRYARVYLSRTPKLVQRWFSGFTWTGDLAEKRVYLTFDDGPIPGVTPWVLDQLAAYNAKATFFCVGENAERHPEVLQQVIDAGHSVGNHTHNHISGWGSDNLNYVENVERCAKVIKSKLFRPPYGRISPRKAEMLQRRYRIVMWDVLSGDFDQDLNPLICLRNVLDNVKPGSIVVFHDSLKSERNLKYALPRTLAVLSKQGYSFEAIPQSGASFNNLVRSASAYSGL